MTNKKLRVVEAMPYCEPRRIVQVSRGRQGTKRGMTKRGMVACIVFVVGAALGTVLWGRPTTSGLIQPTPQSGSAVGAASLPSQQAPDGIGQLPLEGPLPPEEHGTDDHTVYVNGPTLLSAEHEAARVPYPAEANELAGLLGVDELGLLVELGIVTEKQADRIKELIDKKPLAPDGNFSGVLDEAVTAGIISKDQANRILQRRPQR